MLLAPIVQTLPNKPVCCLSMYHRILVARAAHQLLVTVSEAMRVVCHLQGIIYTLNGQLHECRPPSGATSEGQSVRQSVRHMLLVQHIPGDCIVRTFLVARQRPICTADRRVFNFSIFSEGVLISHHSLQPILMWPSNGMRRCWY